MQSAEQRRGAGSSRSRARGGGPRRSRPPRSVLAFALLLATLIGGPAAGAEERSLILATTTSVRDSGLLDALLPDFREQTGIRVRVIAVGTGAALRMGREGNADLLLTHSPAAEQALVEEGVATRRTPFMENHFVIAGPPEDPARVAEAASPEEALARIAKARAPWISRADDSGTHKKEKALFAAAGLAPDASWPDLDRTGSGMGLTLQVAGERRAYVLSDVGTFLAFQQRTGLVVLSKPSPSLRNVYSLIQLDPRRFEKPLHTAEAEALEAHLLREDVQTRIGEFGRDRYGRSLFTPLRPATRESRHD